MFSIHDQEKVKEFLAEIWEKPFRYGQIENAIYKNFITDFDDIQTIPQALRDKLKENFHYTSLEVDHQATSKNDQTTKLLFKTADDLLIEAVIMRHKTGRNTLCISCQAGCPMACSYVCSQASQWWMSKAKEYSFYVNGGTNVELRCYEICDYIYVWTKEVWSIK